MRKTEKGARIDEDLVRNLARLLEETGLSEIEYGTDGWHVRVSRGNGAADPIGSQPAATGAAAALHSDDVDASEAAADDLAAHPGVVSSPMVGVAYTSPDPETPPFVEPGDAVEKGDTLLVIEAMKVFNPVSAPRAGRIARILIGNGTPVEYGEPLLIIE